MYGPLLSSIGLLSKCVLLWTRFSISDARFGSIVRASVSVSVFLRFSDFGCRCCYGFRISVFGDFRTSGFLKFVIPGRNRVSQAETGSLRPKPGLSEDSRVTRGFRFAISVFRFCHFGFRCLEICRNTKFINPEIPKFRNYEIPKWPNPEMWAQNRCPKSFLSRHKREHSQQ